MKIPAHCYEPVTVVCHPANTLRNVAKWLELDAALYRREGNKDGAFAIKVAALSLRKIADGITPAEAFEFPEPELKESA